MTLFSFHHNSNFLGLVPPALWRDPGHCAGGRRGKTERITHPGKTDVQCGVFVFSPTHLFLPSEKRVRLCVSNWEREKGVERYSIDVQIKISFFNLCVWRTHFTFSMVCFWHQSVRSFSCGPQRPPIHLLIMDNEGQGLAKSSLLHPPFPLPLYFTIIDELPKGYLFCSLLIYVFLASESITWRQGRGIWGEDALCKPQLHLYILQCLCVEHQSSAVV